MTHAMTQTVPLTDRPSWKALQKWNAKLMFKIGQMPAERRRGNVQILSRRPD